MVTLYMLYCVPKIIPVQPRIKDRLAFLVFFFFFAHIVVAGSTTRQTFHAEFHTVTTTVF